MEAINGRLKLIEITVGQAGRLAYECSVMATKYLGDTIGFHAGRQDLFIPHHEIEIAQSEG